MSWRILRVDVECEVNNPKGYKPTRLVMPTGWTYVSITNTGKVRFQIDHVPAPIELEIVRESLVDSGTILETRKP